MKLFLSIALILFVQFANAQDSLQKSSFKISINYNSNLNYYGRTGSLQSSGVFPLVEYWLKKGFYVNVAPIFVNNAMESMNYAGTVATAGYLHTNDKMFFNLFVSKPFYPETSQLVQSAIKIQSGVSYSFLNKILNVTAGGDVKQGEETDFGLMAGVDHLYRKEFSNNSILAVNPAFSVNAGTQRFTKTYFRKSSFLFFPDQQVTENVKKLNVLAYEFSIPVIFGKGKFQFTATPSYIIPQNVIKVEGRPDLSEQGERMFYLTTSAKIIL